MWERMKASFSRFDVILIFILSFAVFLVCVNVWLITHGYEQLSSSFWDFCKTMTGGEIVAFSLYQIAKKVMESRTPKSITAKHSYINDLEGEDAK